MKYPVLTTFRDKHTKVIHRKGTQYKTDDEKRAKELQDLGFIGNPSIQDMVSNVGTVTVETGNTIGEAMKDVAEKVESGAEEWPKSAGGGYWDLPNGERVRGKENALKALAELNADEGGDSDDDDEAE